MKGFDKVAIREIRAKGQQSRSPAISRQRQSEPCATNKTATEKLEHPSQSEAGGDARVFSAALYVANN